MNLTELNSPPTAALPISELSDQLRLGRGFSDDGAQDGLLEALLRAAIATIEGRTGRTLLERDYAWELNRWFAPDRQGLPVGPVSAIASLVIVGVDGTETTIPDGDYRLYRDLYRPEVQAAKLPSIPDGGLARITFTAGFGPNWSDCPADLQQAVMILAANYYEHRDQAGEAGLSLPFSVLSLIERYRTVRVLGDRL